MLISASLLLKGADALVNPLVAVNLSLLRITGTSGTAVLLLLLRMISTLMGF
jgi:hypothetical protein